MRTKRLKISTVVIYFVITIVALFTLIPFIVVVSGSFTSERDLVVYGASLLPRNFTTAAYSFLMANRASIVTGYRVTLTVTIVGTALSLYLTTTLAYVISIKTVKLRNTIAFFVYFTMLFNGGIVPWFIWIVRHLQLRDSIWVLILPMAINAFFVMIMRTSLASLPESLRESAIIDGASEFKILYKIILPVSKPIIATVTLFYMLNYWNDWFHALFFIDDRNLVPLQFNLYRIVSNLAFLSSSDEIARTAAQHVTLPTESVRMATVVLTIGPIVFVYPFIQKHFVKGITIGAVKG